MNPELRAAHEKRETKAMKLVRWAFTKTVEAWLRTLPQDPELFRVTWKILVDTAALYAFQSEVTKEQFLEWAAESYELYSAIVKKAGQDPDAVKKLVTEEF